MTAAEQSLPMIKNRYRLVEEIGQGGMGIVYKARDRLTRQRVALKRLIVPPEYLEFLSQATSENLLLSLAHEFQVAASLRHPHIIQVFDYGFDTDQQPYLVMELLQDGEPLPTFARRQPLDRLVRLLVDTLHALEYLHHRGIIHRDLKPGNVLVDSQQVKVLDFGLSMKRGQLTTVEGTIPYIAPEVLAGQLVSESSDLYAVGVIAYEMLTGRQPFFHGDVQETIRMIREDPPNLTLMEIPVPLRPILERLLAKQPDQRFAAASEVIDELSRAQGILVEESFWLRESFLQAAAFTGRDEELSLLHHALQRAKAGEGFLWLVEGESGIGKSRLLSELRIRALVEGVEVFTGQTLHSSGQPYQPWREVLQRLALHIPLTNEAITMLKLIVPDIDATLETTTGSPPLPEDIGKRLPEFVAGLFSHVQQPALVLLEDLQWAGSESLEVLKRLVDSISGLPLLVVGTYRSDEGEDLSRNLPGTQVLRLHRLTSAQIADLSVSMLGETGRSPAILTLLEHESEGNVFFVIEVLRALAEEAGRLSEVPTMSLPSRVFTQGIQSLIERRLARIPQTYWQILELAAVSGRYLDTQVLRTLQESAEGIETHMDNFLRTGAAAAVLEIVDNQWRFTHDKIREGILATIDVDRLPMYHLRVAEAIEVTYASHAEFASALAYHYARAERWEKELVYSEVAGKEADHRGAYVTAIQYHQRVLDLLSPENQAQRAVILGIVGREYVAAGDFARAEAFLQESLQLAKAVSDRKTMLMNLMRLGLLAYETGRSGESGPYFEEALELAVDIQDQKLLIRSLVELAHHEAMQEKFDSAKRHMTQALDASASIEDPETLAFVNWGAGIIATLQESFSEATDYFQQSRALYQGVNFLSGVLAATNNLGEIFRLQGDYQQAWEYFQEVLKHRLAQGRRKNVASTMVNLGFTATGLGKHQVAHQNFSDSYAIALEIGAPTTALVALVGLAELKAAAGAPITAIAVIGFALAHPASTADVHKDARPVLGRIAADLAPAQVAAAMEQGQHLTMETAASMVLDENSAN